jgi:aldose 1-epimerase
MTPSARGRRRAGTWRRTLCLLLSATVGSALLLLWLPASAQTASRWGRHAGRAVDLIRLRNRRGMTVVLSDYGAMIDAIEVPDRAGRLADVVLGFRSLETYEATPQRYGGVIGRYAGRIDHARFVLDHRTFHLTPGRNGVTLHGGPIGYDRRVWAHRLLSGPEGLGVGFQLVSPAGDQHFPGRLDVSVTYWLARERNALTILYAARSDAPTVVNLTNHVFFNLAGAGVRGLAGERFRIMADRYVEVDARKIPDGQLPSVVGTPFDFLRPHGIEARLRSGNPLLGAPPGYDVTLVFSHWTGALAHVASIWDTGSGRRLDVYTSEPAVQFNTGTGFDGRSIGREGRAYVSGDGFSLETEHLPDSPNRPAFPSTVVRPGKPYRSETRLQFSIGPGSPRAG